MFLHVPLQKTWRYYSLSEIDTGHFEKKQNLI